MTDFPTRISISPLQRQKRDDDFYLVDREAFPGKGKEYIREDISDAAVLVERAKCNELLTAARELTFYGPTVSRLRKLEAELDAIRARTTTRK